MTPAQPDDEPHIRVGVFGGSFDPVHTGHFLTAKRAEEAFGLQRIVWVPAGQPPHKPDRQLAPDHMRLYMAMLAIAFEPDWEVSTAEFEREGPSYTYDTLLQLLDVLEHRYRAQRSGDWSVPKRRVDLFLIIGTDNLPGLPGWRNAEDVVRIAQPIVAQREERDPGEILEGIRGRMSAEAIERIERGLMRVPPAPQSSTAIREALARGEAPAEGAVLDEVLDFIVEQRLYGWPEGVPSPVPPAPPREQKPLQATKRRTLKEHPYRRRR